MKNQFRHALLGSVAALTLAVVANGAQAQVQSPGWFGSLEGWWYPWNSSGSFLKVTDSGAAPGKTRPADGPGGRAYAGYRFSNPFDLALGAQGTWLSKGKGTSFAESGSQVTPHQKAWYWAGDLEVGYNGSNGAQFGYRLFAGARYAHFSHTTTIFEPGTPSGTVKDRENFNGIGPRIGASGAYRLMPGGAFSIFGDISGSYLFGKRKETESFGPPNTTYVHAHSGKNAWNAEGQLGVAYDIAPNTSLAVGYRGEYWNNVVSANLDNDVGASGNGHRLVHGPFVRVAYNIGAPTSAPIAAAAPPPAAMMAKTFIVFFDFDRSTLTPDALKTIADAAAASKTGGVQRVNVTGHADRSGSDQYNMALSLRRAGAVKDQLVRNGVPAGSIVVVGRGESQPLVPTADGVREPQNRRVEIVLQ